MKRDSSESQRLPGRKGLDAIKSIFSDYRSKLVRRAERARRRLLRHSIVYGATNLFLLLINIVVGISFPWFLFPLGGWGIVLAGHAALARQRQRQGGEVAAIEELSTYQTRLLRRYHRRRTGFALTTWSSLVTALFLGMTNLIVSPHFPWALITAGAFGLGELIYYLTYSARQKALEGRIAAELPAGTVAILRSRSFSLTDRSSSIAEASDDQTRSARLTRERIIRQLSEMGDSQTSLAGELSALLDRYLGQIEELVRRRDEVAALSERAQPEDVAKERERLTAKLEGNPSDAVRREYERSIRRLDAQLDSIRRLDDHLQIAELRLSSALSALKQLEMDVVRMKGVPDFEGGAVSKALNDRTAELSEYLEDLAKGQREVEELD